MLWDLFLNPSPSFSEAELFEEEERPEDPEERSARGQEAAAIRPERDVLLARREVTKKSTIEDTTEAKPGPSRGRREEEMGQRQATTWSWSVPTTSSSHEIPITISLPKGLDLYRYLPPPTVSRPSATVRTYEQCKVKVQIVSGSRNQKNNHQKEKRHNKK